MKKATYFVFLMAFIISLVGCGTPLVRAAGNGEIDRATALLDKGADVNESYYGLTPLIQASQWGKTEMVKLLLGKGANINLQICGGTGEDRRCSTALTAAAANGYNDIVQILIQKGAEVSNYDVELVEKFGNTKTIQMLKSAQSKTISTVHNADLLLIAVIDFDGKGVSKADASRVSEWLRTELINTGQFKVIERSAMNAILKEQAFAQTGCTDTSCAVQVGKLLSAKKMLVGTVETWKNKVFINGRIIDVEKGIAEFAHKETVNTMDELDTGAASFAKNLAKRINGM